MPQSYRQTKFKPDYPSRLMCECAHETYLHKKPSLDDSKLYACIVPSCGCNEFKRVTHKKWRARRVDHDGQKYDSKEERDLGIQLGWAKDAGDITELTRQRRFSFDLNGVHICEHLVDFDVTWKSGQKELIEYKGRHLLNDKTWQLKKKLLFAFFLSQHPEYEYRVITK
jgi:hypothetical protein